MPGSVVAGAWLPMEPMEQMFSHPQTGATKAEFSVLVSFGDRKGISPEPLRPVSLGLCGHRQSCVKSDSGRISGLRPFNRKKRQVKQRPVLHAHCRSFPSAPGSLMDSKR